MKDLKELLNQLLQEQVKTRKVLTRIEYHLLMNAVHSEVPDISDGENFTTSLSEHTKSQLETIRFSMKLLHDALPEANEEAINKYHYNRISSFEAMPRNGFFVSDRVLGQTENGRELLKQIITEKTVRYLELEKVLMPLYGQTHTTRLRQKLASCAKSEERKGSYPKKSQVMRRIKNFQKNNTGKKFPIKDTLTKDEFFSIIWLFVLSLGFPVDPDKSYLEVDDF
jgi:hypothetical protein